MPNIENLMPIEEVNSRRTREQHSRDSSKAGKASAKKRRQNKTFKELCDKFINNEITSEDLKEKMIAFGVADEDVSYKMAMVVSLCSQAVKGNVKAFEIIRDTVGEKPKEKIGIETNPDSIKILASINRQLGDKK